MIVLLYYILVGLMLGAKAQLTLSELEQKVDNLEEQLEYGGKMLQKFYYNSK